MIRLCGESGLSFYETVSAAAFETLNLSGEALIGLTLVSGEEIRALNLKERSVDKITDVLSFPMLEAIKPFTKENYPFDFDEDENAVYIGDIVICEEVAIKQALEYGHSVEREKAYLYLHGVLHLLGYDHITDKDKASMRLQEEKILNSLGLSVKEEN